MRFDLESQLRTGMCLLAVMALAAFYPLPTDAKGKPPKDDGGNDSGIVEMRTFGQAQAHLICEERLGASTSDALCNRGTVTPFVLGSYFFDGRDYSSTDAHNCFDIVNANGVATVQLWDNSDGSGEAWIRFHGRKQDPNDDSDVLYVLEVYSPDGWIGEFPPAVDSTSKLEGASWNLRAANKRQGRGACLDSGAFDATDYVDVDFKRLE